MLQIRRTEDDRLQVSNRRQTRIVDSVADARRTLYTWGHTDISINKALAELRQTEGAAGAERGWRVVRPEEAPVVVAEAAEPAPARSKRARGGARAAAEPQPAGTPAELPAVEQPAAAEAVTAAKPRRRRAASPTAGHKQPDTAATEQPEPAAANGAEPPSGDDPAAFPAPAKRRPSRSRSRARREDGDQDVETPTPAETSPAPEPPAKPVRAARKRAQRVAAPLPPVAEPEPSAALAPASPEPATPAVAAAEPRTRTRRRAAAAETRAGDTDSAPADPRERALLLARQLAATLQELERATLPFARGPWADLRGKAEFVADCLQGKTPRD